MRAITRAVLILNLALLLFIVLWLLVGGSNRGHQGGGAASEVDGILLLFLSLFNVAYVTAVAVVTSWPAPAREAAVGQVLGSPGAGSELQETNQGTRRLLRSWSLWALTVNGVLILFVGLWLLISTDRWNRFQANSTEVDMILLLLLTAANLLYMGLICIRFSLPGQRRVEPASPR
jgi:hypothetical protein